MIDLIRQEIGSFIIPITSPRKEKEDEQVRPGLDYPIDNLTTCLHPGKEGLCGNK